MKHATTCLPNGSGICLPDAHAAAPLLAGISEPTALEWTRTGTTDAGACLAAGIAFRPQSRVVTGFWQCDFAVTPPELPPKIAVSCPAWLAATLFVLNQEITVFV